MSTKYEVSLLKEDKQVMACKETKRYEFVKREQETILGVKNYTGKFSRAKQSVTLGHWPDEMETVAFRLKIVAPGTADFNSLRLQLKEFVNLLIMY